MLTVYQFCGAVSEAGAEGGFDMVGKAIRWGYSSGHYFKPMADFLKEIDVEVPKHLRDAAEGKNLKDAKTRAAREVMESYFFGVWEDDEFTGEYDEALQARCDKAAERAGLLRKLEKLAAAGDACD